MNVALCTSNFPPEIGGPASFMPRIAKYLQNAGCEVTIVTTCQENNKVHDQQFPYPIQRIHGAKNRILSAYSIHAQILHATKDCDVILCNGLEAYLLGWPQKNTKPVAIKIVGDSIWETARNFWGEKRTIETFQRSSKNPKIFLRRWLRELTLKRASSIVTPSTYLKELVEQWGIESQKINVIHNGFDLESSLNKNECRKPFTFLFAGRLVNWKGLDILLDALSYTPEAKLIIAGDGPLHHHLKRRSKNENLRVDFTGQLSEKSLSALYQKVDAFVLPSEYEGLPHALVEAQFFGMPSIAFDVGGNYEVIDNNVNGFLISDRNAKSLHLAMKKIMNEESTYIRMSKSALAQSKMFSFSNIGDQYLKLLERLV